MTTTEYGLMIDWEDGELAEVVPAQNTAHAERMAATIYAGVPSWIVQREVPDWCYLGSTTPARRAPENSYRRA